MRPFDIAAAFLKLLLVSVLGSTVGTACAAAIGLLVGFTPVIGGPLPDLALLLICGALFSLPFTLLGASLWGIPVMMVLRKAEAESLGSYDVAGALGGLGFALLAGGGQADGLVFILYGAATSAAFWRVFRRASLREQART